MSSITDFLFQGRPPQSVTTYGQTVENIPKWMSDYTQGLIARANAAAAEPYIPYGGPRIAGFSPEEQPDDPEKPEIPNRRAVFEDFELNLREQLERAKRLLQARQGRLLRSGAIKLRTVGNCRAEWALMLRLLDGIESGAGPDEVAAVLGAQQPELAAGAALRDILARAQALVQGGYRALPGLPE